MLVQQQQRNLLITLKDVVASADADADREKGERREEVVLAESKVPLSMIEEAGDGGEGGDGEAAAAGGIRGWFSCYHRGSGEPVAELLARLAVAGRAGPIK